MFDYLLKQMWQYVQEWLLGSLGTVMTDLLDKVFSASGIGV